MIKGNWNPYQKSFIRRSCKRTEEPERKQSNRPNEKDYNEKKKNVIPNKAKVILTTINKPLKNLPRARIDIIIIDESTRVSVLEAVAAIYEIQPAKLMIATGDVQQLGVTDKLGNQMKNILQL